MPNTYIELKDDDGDALWAEYSTRTDGSKFLLFTADESGALLNESQCKELVDFIANYFSNTEKS